MPGGSVDAGLLLHELGHYFSLAHTMFDSLYKDCGAGNDCLDTLAWSFLPGSGYDPEIAFNADGIQDTPGDPGPWVFKRRAGLAASPPTLPRIPFDNCDGKDLISITDPSGSHAPVIATPDRRNVMSYFGCVPPAGALASTPQQLAAMRVALFECAPEAPSWNRSSRGDRKRVVLRT